MRAALAGLALVAAAPAVAQDDREMNTDRPDKTESPFTVPKGRVQIELDLANYTRDTDDDLRTETVGVTPFNLKLGIDRATDIQFVAAPYIHRTTTDLANRARTRLDGFGDVTIRLKHNLWGDDGGTTAFALMPYVTLPTSRAGLGADRVEFGLIAPLAVTLSDAVDLGLMTEIDVVGDDDGQGRRVNFVNSATVGFALTPKLGLYTELYAERGSDWIVTADTGVTYALSDSVQIDTGVNLGLTRAADGVTMFVGVSRRF